jgi:hypothetical protein
MVGLIGCGCCGGEECPPSPTGWDYQSLPQANTTSRFASETWDSIASLNGDWTFCSPQTVNGVLNQFGAVSLPFKLSDPPASSSSSVFTRADYLWDMTVPQVPSPFTNKAYSKVITGPVINWEHPLDNYGYSFFVVYQIDIQGGGPIPGFGIGFKTYYFSKWNHFPQCGTPSTSAVIGGPPGTIYTVGGPAVQEFWYGLPVSETISAFGNWDVNAKVWDVELKVNNTVKIKANGIIPNERLGDRVCFGEMFVDGAAFLPFSMTPLPAATLPTHDNTLIRYTYT